MQPLTAIIAATDFSPRAERAVLRAAQLASRHGAELHLLHVIGKLPLEAFLHLWDTPLETEQKLVNAAREKLEQAAAALKSRHDTGVHIHVGIGRVHEQVGNYAAAHHAGLVVMGDIGEHFLREVALGTTVSNLLRTSRLPVLVVRREPGLPYQRVLVPVDFSAPSRRALALAQQLLPQLRIDVLHTIEVPFAGLLQHAGASRQALDHYRQEARGRAEQAMQDLIAGSANPAGLSPIIEEGYAPDVINAKALELQTELVVIGKRGTTELDEAMLGSVTKHVLYESPCDVLVAGE